ALAPALPLLAHEGTVLVASWYGTKPVTLHLGQEFHRRRLTLRSTQVSSIPARLADRWDVAPRRPGAGTVAGERRGQGAVALLDERPLNARASHTVGCEDAADAYEALDAREPGLIHAALR